jgi:predicted KAP-like P-loop ATPase
MDVIGEALRLETEKRKTGIEKTREFIKRVRWLRRSSEPVQVCSPEVDPPGFRI